MFDATWLAALRARASQPPLRPRMPLMAGAGAVGSILPALMHKISHFPTSYINSLLLKNEHFDLECGSEQAWRIQGDVTTTLHQLAHALRDANVGHVARNEAGLHLDALGAVQRGGSFTVRRPTGEPDDDDDGIGYMVEVTDWFQCTVPDGTAPVNQDGEVAQFLLLEPDDLVARLHRNEFTLEAALVLVAALGLSAT